MTDPKDKEDQKEKQPEREKGSISDEEWGDFFE